MSVYFIAKDLIREALSRKWVLTLIILSFCILLLMAVAFNFQVIDGALAGTRFFGKNQDSVIQPVDIFMGRIFRAITVAIYYYGIFFGIIGSSNFAPELLKTGRIEFMLSLPPRRFEIIIGTFTGVIALWFAGVLFLSSGITIIFGYKTGFWSWNLILASFLSSVAFFPIYCVMLTATIFKKSAQFSSLCGFLILILGLARSKQGIIGAMMEPGWRENLFHGFISIFPPLNDLANQSFAITQNSIYDPVTLLRLVTGHIIFGLAILAVGIWKFEGEDY